jgi:AraC family transcriptional regulator
MKLAGAGVEAAGSVKLRIPLQVGQSCPESRRIPAMLKQQDRAPKRADTVQFHSVAIKRVISAIREHLDEGISLGEMAAVAYMSPYHFNRTFRRITGLPPRRFLSALRFEAATKKLLESDTSITDICFDVGYNSLGTFIRRFSDVLGISPKQLRRLRQSPTNNLLKPLEKNPDNGVANARPSVKGRIQPGSFFAGPIFVGLFPSPIAEGTPVACTVLFRPDNFVITGVPAGRYYVYALGLPWPQQMDDYFKYESALRGGGETVTVGSSTVTCADIQLRAPLHTDPPIVLNLPVLLEKATLYGHSESSALSEQGFAAKGRSEMKQWRRHTMEEKRIAVERMKTCDNITALAHEYGIQRKLLYVWKHKIEGRQEILSETRVPERTETVLRAG